MATKAEVLKMLNEDLSDELGSIIQYMWHHVSGKGLASAGVLGMFHAAAIDEMKHAEEIAERIDQLGGEPTIKVGEIKTGGNIEKMIRDDLAAEEAAVERYGAQIRKIMETDPATRHMLEDILQDEERHANDWRTLLES